MKTFHCTCVVFRKYFKIFLFLHIHNRQTLIQFYCFHKKVHFWERDGTIYTPNTTYNVCTHVYGCCYKFFLVFPCSFNTLTHILHELCVYFMCLYMRSTPVYTSLSPSLLPPTILYTPHTCQQGVVKMNIEKHEMKQIFRKLNKVPFSTWYERKKKGTRVCTTDNDVPYRHDKHFFFIVFFSLKC